MITLMHLVLLLSLNTMFLKLCTLDVIHNVLHNLCSVVKYNVLYTRELAPTRDMEKMVLKT